MQVLKRLSVAGTDKVSPRYRSTAVKPFFLSLSSKHVRKEKKNKSRTEVSRKCTYIER